MKFTNILFFVVLLTFLACDKKDDHKAESHEHESHDMTQQVAGDNEKVVYYTCPMESHKQIHAKEPGKCPECGMEMVAGVITTVENMEYYGCPMLSHSHVRKEKPGKCDECGMMLKPMRLVKNDKM